MVVAARIAVCSSCGSKGFINGQSCTILILEVLGSCIASIRSPREGLQRSANLVIKALQGVNN